MRPELVRKLINHVRAEEQKALEQARRARRLASCTKFNMDALRLNDEAERLELRAVQLVDQAEQLVYSLSAQD